MLKKLFIKANNFIMDHLPAKRMTSRIWTNPDGTTGGVVSLKAQVPPDVHVPKSAVIIDDAIVKSGDKINPGDIVTPNGIIRFGNPTIKTPAI